MARNPGYKVDWAVAGPKVEAWLRREAAGRPRLRGLRLECLKVLAPEIPGLTKVRLDSWLDTTAHALWEELRAAVALRVPPAPAPAPPLDPVHPQLRALEVEVRELRDEGMRLRQKLAVADRERSVVDELAEVVRAEMPPIPYVPFTPREPKVGQEPVDFAVTLADEHADRVVSGPSTWGMERYDYNIFRCRLSRWVKVIGDYATRHLPRYLATRLWVFLLGDGLNGDIHNMKYRNFFANSIRAALAVGDAEGQAIAALAPLFPGGVHVVGVSGNHARQTQKPDPEDPHDNLDYLRGVVMAQRLRGFIDEGKVEVHLPRAWEAYVEILGHLHALNHGAGVRGTWGISWYGFNRLEGRLQAILGSQQQTRVEYFWYGHYHTPTLRSEQFAKAIHAGAWYLTDAYSLGGALGAEPEQPLQVFTEQRGRLMEIPIYLRDADAEDRFRRGEWEPELGRQSVLDLVGAMDEVAEAGGFPVIRAGRRGAAA